MPRFQWLSVFSRAVFTVCSLVAIALISSAETSLLAADRVEVSAQIVSKEGGQQAELQITARIQPGWHIYSITQKPGGPKPTRINLVASDRYRILGKFVAVPPATIHHYDFWPDLDVEEHEDQVTWSVPVEAIGPEGWRGVTISGDIQGQVCKDLCVNFSQSFEVKASSDLLNLLSVGIANTTTNHNEVGSQSSVAPPFSQAGELIIQLASAMLAGVFLNVMPCVLPVIGLKVMSFVQQAGESRKRIFALNAWFSLGLMSVFWALATLAVGVRFATQGDLEFGWGEQFQFTSFNIILTSVVFAFALSFLGVWEIPIPGFVGSSSANEVAEREGAAGAFIKGVLATVLATPCVGPLLIPATTWAIQQPVWLTYTAFTFIGLGMASPYLAIGAYPRLMSFLPKPGNWMVAFKQIMGFVLMGTVVWLFSSLSDQYHTELLALLVSIGFACWVVGRLPVTVSASIRFQSWGWAIGAVAYVAVVAFGTDRLIIPVATIVTAFAIAVWILMQLSENASIKVKAWCWSGAIAVLLISTTISYFALQHSELPWEPFSRAELNTYLRNGQTVLVDFTADW
jgi:suppressor for copper-sensitivity B